MDTQYIPRAQSGRTPATRPSASNASEMRKLEQRLHSSKDTAEALEEELSRLKLSAKSYTPRLVSDEILPGIPTRQSMQRSHSAQDTNTAYTWENEEIARRPIVPRAHSIDEEFMQRRNSINLEKLIKTWDDEPINASSGRRTWQSTPRHRPGSIPEGARIPLARNGKTPNAATATAAAAAAAAAHRPQASSATPNMIIAAAEDRRRNSSSRPTSNSPNRSDVDLGRIPRSPTHARKMLHLMNMTQGFVHGGIYFRKASATRWLSSYCCVDVKTGSLLCVYAKGSAFKEELVPDLRGCTVKAAFDPEKQATILILSADCLVEDLYIRPKHHSQFETWFAALMCWRPVPASQSLGEPRSHLLPTPVPLDAGHSQDVHPSERSKRSDGAIIKVGKFSLWDHSEIGKRMIRFPDESSSASVSSNPPTGSVWRRVTATFRDDGTLQLFTTPSSVPTVTVKFSLLKRSAVQRLHRSLFNSEFCLGIYPQYSPSEEACSRLRPIHLNFEDRVLFEVWYVLFRAYAMPEIFGPQISPHSTDAVPSEQFLPGLSKDQDPALFRIERSIHMRIAEARFRQAPGRNGVEPDSHEHLEYSRSKANEIPQYQARMLIDGQVKAKTTSKTIRDNPFWYESFDLLDLPLAACCMSIEVWENFEKDAVDASAPRSPVAASTAKHTLRSYWEDQAQPPPKDCPRGEVIIDIIELMAKKDTDQWWPLVDHEGRAVGEISLKIQARQDNILMDRDYLQLSEILHNFSNTLTLQLAERIPSELTRLSECLVDIFQVSGKACEWLMSVAEEEIDSTRGEMQTVRSRFIKRVNSNEERRSRSSHQQHQQHQHDEREIIVRDFSRSASTEANLLFRGNTILSKSLDRHMKRLGRDYLEATLGPKLRSICEQNPDCEVDPSKVVSAHDREKNWKRLITLTQDVWKLIFSSAAHCPLELRTVLRHIRACAEDRYGVLLRSVPYSSVSGFLFLRFFCPAVLNPKLFGLIPDNPEPMAQRAFTLIAKSLQVLANGSTFGTKQPWMKPMNEFLDSHKQNFKGFIDSICGVPAQQPPPQLELPYSTPLAVFTRLPLTFREGFPSLPYLIDHSRSFAALVELWLNTCNAKSGNNNANKHLEDDLLHFHNICNSIRQRTIDSVLRAERSERHFNSIAQKWVALAERMELSPEDFWVDLSTAHGHNKQHHLHNVFHTHNQSAQGSSHLHQHHTLHHQSSQASSSGPDNVDSAINPRSRAISSPPTANSPTFAVPIIETEDAVASDDEMNGGVSWSQEWRAPLAQLGNDSAASSDTEGASSRPHSAAGVESSRKKADRARFGLFARKKRDGKE